jgi:hypothetical protein
LARARQSRRPSRLGATAGAAPKPDYLFEADAGFPGLLARVWQEAAAAPSLSAAFSTLLTLGGRVPASVQLRALRLAEEAALKVLCGVSWRQQDSRGDPGHESAGRPAFLGELGLTTSGRVVLSVPSHGTLATGADLVGGVMRVPWSAGAVAEYLDEMSQAAARYRDSVADCHRWLAAAGARGRYDLLEQLKEAALRTAPFVFYQEDRRYTNFRERNNLTGKTLWPGHPDCALSSLQSVPLELWSDNDLVMVVCLTLLTRSVGFARIEEANGTQLTVDHVADLLERTRVKYNQAAGGRKVAPAASGSIGALNELAEALRDRRREIGPSVQLYREIHGPLLHKIERVAGPRRDTSWQRERDLCARLRGRIPVRCETLDELGTCLAASPAWLAQPHGGFGTGLESLVYETVSAARQAFDADFAMSRGMRSLRRLVQEVRNQDWAQITKWDLPEFFCCVVPAPEACRYFDGSAARLADVAWSMSARMQYNSWHFIAGNLPKVPEVVARDFFVPPTIPDIAYYSDQHHHGHVAARVRFSIRSPQPVTILGRKFSGFIDVRLLRCGGLPFDEQDLLAAHRASAFIAQATGLVAALVEQGANADITAFDPGWHWETIAAGQAPSFTAAGPAAHDGMQRETSVPSSLASHGQH